jgi:thiopeptide-type bacteriocin biosynthesis protein
MKTTSFGQAFVRVPLAGYSAIENLDWATLAAQLQNPAFLEALFIASPSLYEEAIKLDLSKEPDDKNRKVIYSLIKYLSRYATRCTPFGLFSGFSTLPIDTNSTQVFIKTGEGIRKVIRLDMNYLCALAQDLEKHPAVKPYLHFYPNSSLYEINGQYRYVAYQYNAANMRVHHLSSAEKTPYLDTLFEKAHAGARISELETAILGEEVTAQEAQAFVAQVLDSQLLVSELEPSLTGEDFLLQIIATLNKVQAQFPSRELETIIALLSEVKADLKRLETEGQTHGTGKFITIEQKLSVLPTPINRKALFQIDTYLPETTGSLNRGLINKLIAKIPALLKLTPHSEGIVGEFKNKFIQKYEDEEVPLVVALDPELGIGFPAGGEKADLSPLVEGVPMGSEGARSRSLSIPKEHDFIVQKVAEAQLSRQFQVILSEEDLRGMDTVEQNLPLTNTAMFSVLREQGKEYIVLDTFGGTTGTFLLGRFGHTDPAVLNMLQEISRTEDEAMPEAIFADIVHLPEARTGNVIIRPALKNYQIPYLGKASVDREHQIPLTDLLISVRGNCIILRSKSLNKVIIPRLSNAHNFSNPDSLDVYHFLCALQSQGVRTSLSGVLSSFSSLFVFTPRIVLENIILAEAQWNCRAEQLKEVITAAKKGKWTDLKAQIDQWRQKYQIPQHICLVDFDNELYINLENQWLTETFVHEIKARETFTIKEYLFNPGNAVVESEKSKHSNQFVVAFQNQPEKVAKPVQPSTASAASQEEVARKFFSGSEWLYYKVYTGVKTADNLLTNVLYPLSERFKTKGWIDKFFFIRYADPSQHFRFRFHLTHPKYTGKVIGELHKHLAPYLDSKAVTAIVNDTYNRELERYGKNSIDAVEEYFHTDSQTILQFLSMIEGAEGEECRWRFGMQMLNDLLNLFGFDLKQKLDFTELNAMYFGKEFGYNQDLKKNLDARYKEIEAAIVELFAEANEEHQFFYQLSHQRSSQLVDFAQKIQSLSAQGELQISIQSLLGSLIHMNVNRLFRSRQRFVEYSLYYHLSKYYRIQYGRTVLAVKKSQPQVATV